jgi:predicted MFS family arabinose efflux permease
MSETHAPPSDARPPEFGSGYQRYALSLLLIVYIFNFIDRQIVTILMEGIKQEFQLSDRALGFFGGTAFGIFYAVLGLPIARFADRSVRRNIIAVALFVWSGMTALQGLATSFMALAIARIGVGVGEAGCSPPAHSLISDLFPPNRRATALAIYATGIPIGSEIGLVAGGWIREIWGWREAFMVVGLPGLVLALLFRFAFKEPTRGYYDPPPTTPAAQASLLEVGRFLARLPSFGHLAFAGALHAFYGYGAASFVGPFFERLHGFQSGELGTLLGLISMTTGVGGTFLGGYISDRIATRDVRWYAWLPGVSTAVGIPFVCLYYLWPDGYGALLLSMIPSLVGGMYLGPTFAITQALVPLRFRAQAAAFLLLIFNLIGLGLGPWFVGFLSDVLEPTYGIESIRYALLYSVVGGALWATVHYFLGARTLKRDLEAKEEWG